MLKVVLVIGTRPEAIKMAPVVWELRKQPQRVRTIVCVTGQHREMLDQALELFDLTPDHDLAVMRESQTLHQLTADIVVGIGTLLERTQPDWVFVQGDTTTSVASSLAASYQGVKVGHVEAGLRTNDKRIPFPEELNRRITSVIADLHFAPTPRARDALLAERVPPSAIRVTGNTVIDALTWVRRRIRERPPQLPDGLPEQLDGKRVVLVTGHRRESFGPGFEQICLALRDIVESAPETCVVYPVHLNPRVREPVFRLLGNVERIHLIPPLPYEPFVWLMDHSYLVLTDSGGVQEEAPSLGKPVLVMRETTERPEGIAAGNASLVGVSRSRIAGETLDLLANEVRYQRMAQTTNPYGDGRAAERIVDALLA
jgi:UDP-N-acetylglucosamine 2-epimerase (non-hydrolysing)